MIEITEGFIIPGIVAVERAELDRANEVLRLATVVVNCAGALQVVALPEYDEARVEHSAERGTRLSVRRNYDKDKDEKEYIESINLGVRTPDVEMFLGLKHNDVPIYRLVGDPFVDMIMDYFASHEQGKKPSISN